MSILKLSETPLPTEPPVLPGQPRLKKCRIVAVLLLACALLPFLAIPGRSLRSFSNSEFRSSVGWDLLGDATLDDSMSTRPGSGSLRVALAGRLTSGELRVTPGQVYTVRGFVRSASWPAGNISFLFTELKRGKRVRQLQQQVSAIGPGAPNEWSPFAVVYTIPESVTTVRLDLRRYNKQASLSDLWIDELEVRPGVDVPKVIDPKKGFAGSKTRLDSL